MGNNGAVRDNDTKKQGTLYETKFISECIARGLHPHDTVGDYLHHDMLVMNNAGKVYKVQVKGTESPCTQGRRIPRYRITAKMGSRRATRILDCTKVDILAAYVGPHDVWYLIPCLKLKNFAVWLFPDNPVSKAQYEVYKENWECFF